MTVATQCSVCTTSLVGVAPFNGAIICPRCHHPVSELAMLSVNSPSFGNRPARARKSNGWLIPLGYAAFVIIPGVIATYFLMSYLNKPEEVQVEKAALPSTAGQSSQAPKPNAELLPKKTQTPTPAEKPAKVPTSANATVAISDKPKQNSTAPQSKPDINSESKDDVLTQTATFEVAPPPREMKVFGTLRLVTSVAVKDGVKAWVEIDGKEEAKWRPGKFQVELKLAPGQYSVQVIAIYKDKRRTIYEGEVEITANKFKEVSFEPGK